MDSPSDRDVEESAHVVPAGSRVLVTGATGFVGGHVVRSLVLAGFEPVCIVRSAERLRDRLGEELTSRCRAVEADLFDEDALREAATGCAAAIHLIGIIREVQRLGQSFERMHIEATRRVLSVCAHCGIGRYVHMSALGARRDGISVYHQTKARAEEIVRASGLAWTILRPSLIHGPDGEFMRMMRSFCTDRLRTPILPFFGSGRAMLQPVSVLDVADCFVRALSLPATVAQTFELGGPDRLTWRELYDACAEAFTGRKRLKMSVPVIVAELLARTVVPILPKFLMPYKFDVGQVRMSQVDSICDTEPIERAFGIRLRSFRAELNGYASRITTGESPTQ